MSETEALEYSAFAKHIRCTLNQDDISRAKNAINQAVDTQKTILNLHRSSLLEENDAKVEIYDLIETPDIVKLNKLFRSPINILPSDMKYSAKAAHSAQESLRDYTAACSANKSTMESPATDKFDSIEDFDEFRNLLRSTHPMKNTLETSESISERRFELDMEIEQCLNALLTFESKFSDLKQVPEIPNKLDENVHERITELSKSVTAVDEFIQANIGIVETASRIEESQKTLPGSSTSRDIDEILCRVENLAFPTSCDDHNMSTDFILS